jgi:hypothetical protein
MNNGDSFRRSDCRAMPYRFLSRVAILMAFYGFTAVTAANANPFLAKTG